MIKRYPHTAIMVSSSSTQDENGDFTNDKLETIIKGRYEPNSQSKSLDYSAKFYCKRMKFEKFKKDETTLKYGDRSFTILQFHEYQTHSELWLS